MPPHWHCLVQFPVFFCLEDCERSLHSGTRLCLSAGCVAQHPGRTCEATDQSTSSSRPVPPHNCLKHDLYPLTPYLLAGNHVNKDSDIAATAISLRPRCRLLPQSPCPTFPPLLIFYSATPRFLFVPFIVLLSSVSF